MRNRHPATAARRFGRTSIVAALMAACLAGTASGAPGSSVVSTQQIEQEQHLRVASHADSVVRPSRKEDRPVVRATRGVVMLLNAHRVFSALPAGASWITTLRALRPITGSPTVVPVLGRATGTDGAQWLRVLIPGRPNGRSGWIAQRGTVSTSTFWHVVVRTSTRRVLIYRQGRLARSFPAIVGKPSTPTPHGHFFVEESVLMPRASAGAPFALALSARSNALQRFEGGTGQIALHGVANLSGTLGTASSHGCVRLATPSIRWLAHHIAPGTPVTITA